VGVHVGVQFGDRSGVATGGARRHGHVTSKANRSPSLPAAAFSDPDGSTWLLQAITERLLRRV